MFSVLLSRGRVGSAKAPLFEMRMPAFLESSAGSGRGGAGLEALKRGRIVACFGTRSSGFRIL